MAFCRPGYPSTMEVPTMALSCCRLSASKKYAIFTSSHPALGHPISTVRASSIRVNEEGNNGELHMSSNLESQGDGIDLLKLQEGVGSKSASSSDVMKLFNDVQQNMLFLNKQRIDALDDLEKVKREKEVLQAKLSLLEAEVEAIASERDLLQEELQTFQPIAGKGQEMQNRRENSSAELDSLPSPIFSELLVRIDSMVLTGTINAGEANLLKRLALRQDAQAAKVFSSLRPKGDEELARGLLPLLDPNRRYGLHIAHICTELDPIAMSGAIGNFVLNLSIALRRKGNLVEVILPKYTTMDINAIQNLREIQVGFHSFFGGQWHKNVIWTGVVHGIAVTLIDPLHPAGFFHRDHFYEYNDDFERFSYFCRAALDYILKSRKQPDVLHLHDWQTALVGPLFWELFANQGLEGTRILFTCNDFKNQCLQEPAKLNLCGLDPDRLHRDDRMQDNVQPNLVNIVKAGIVYSNKVTTSLPYLYEREYEHGLQSTLTAYKNKCIKIINGLNAILWNPGMDRYLPSTYSLENLAGKLTCKRHLKQKLNLQSLSDSVPLVGCLVPGGSELEVGLIRACWECANMKGAEFLFMGGSKILGLLFEIEERGGTIIESWDDSMAHLIMAASDMVFCTAIDEEASELPLIAMQYGSIPIMKEQEDSKGWVHDADDVSCWMDANAFLYQSGTVQDVRITVTKAIDCFANDPERWKQLMRNGMSHDFSWDGECVQAYLNAYTSIKQL